jgi:hypothetical protein
MKKYTLFLIGITVLKTTIAQRTGIMPYVEDKVTYSNVVEFSDTSMTKNVLYNNPTGIDHSIRYVIDA